jgi:hypothetical protein
MIWFCIGGITTGDGGSEESYGKKIQTGMVVHKLRKPYLQINLFINLKMKEKMLFILFIKTNRKKYCSIVVAIKIQQLMLKSSLTVGAIT